MVIICRFQYLPRGFYIHPLFPGGQLRSHSKGLPTLVNAIEKSALANWSGFRWHLCAAPPGTQFVLLLLMDYYVDGNLTNVINSHTIQDPTPIAYLLSLLSQACCRFWCFRLVDPNTPLFADTGEVHWCPRLLCVFQKVDP